MLLNFETKCDILIEVILKLTKMKKIILSFLVGIMLFSPALSAEAAFTAERHELPPVGALPTETGLDEETDLLDLISRIILYALGLIGAVTLGLFLFGAWQYMTAGGDTKKTEDAVKLMINCVIGLIVIFLAWTISNSILAFVFYSEGMGGGGA
jgi:hypothetical protein